MLLLLLSFALCELKVSDVNIRLPIYCDKEGTRPYQYITCYSPNAEFKKQSEEFIDIELISKDETAVVIKVSVKYSDPEPVATEIQVTYGDESAKITVNIDRIDHLQILSTDNTIYVKKIIPIKLNAFNEKGLIFSSLNGTILNWNSTDVVDPPFDFYNIEDTPLKGRFDPSHYRIIRPKRNATTNITCELPFRDATMGNQEFIFNDKIIFHPKHIYMLVKAETSLHIYYANVISNDLFQANFERPINLTNDYNLFTIKSYSPRIASVSQTGWVEALDLGETTVVIRDKYLLSNSDNAIIHVIIPNGALWEEQWIKSSDQNTGPDAIGPFEPNTSTIKFLFDDNDVIAPNDLKIELSDEWKEIGKHSVTVTFPDVPFEFQGIVHTCQPPTVDPPQVRLPVGYNNYQFSVLGGSGDYDFEYDSSSLRVDDNFEPIIDEFENGTITSTHSVSPLKEGTAVIIIHDKKFEGYTTTLTIVTAEPHSIVLQVNDTELFVGEKFVNYTAYVYDKDDNLFDNVENVDIVPEDVTILNENLIGTSPGFTNIQGSIGQIKSNVKKILVMDRLSVSSPLNGNSMMTYNLNRTGGPVPWENAGQTNVIFCDGAKFDFVDNKTYIKFLEDFEGECKLEVQNEQTEENPNPRVVDTYFSVSLLKLCYVAILATDSDSINDPSCNLLMSNIDDNSYIVTEQDDGLERVDHARIPYNHTIELKLFAFGEDDKRLGIYNEPGADITYENINGEVYTYNEPFQVTEDINVTVNTKEQLTIYTLNVEVILPHRISEPNPFSLYKESKEGAEAHIIHGNGPFNVSGYDISLIPDRVLLIAPDSTDNTERTANITDRCIPENIYTINITTFSVGSIVIDGPSKALVGDKLQFQAILITPEGKELPPQFNDQVNWHSDTPGLTFNNETGMWEIDALKPGRLEIILTADNKRKTHPVDVYEKIVPKYENLTMFVGERLPLEFNDDFDKEKIEVVSSDPEVVSFVDNLIAVAHQPGKVQVTASFANHSDLGSAVIYIQVVEAKNLILECNKTNLVTGDPVYVGSYVHVVPYIETDIGLLPPKTIEWDVDGNENWEKLYDHSIIIKGDEEGRVIVTAHSINNLENSTNIDFDYKLKFSNLDHIKIPLGSTYDLKPDDDIEGVTYTIAPYSCLHPIKGSVTINETGQIFAGTEGRYIVIVNYKNQWQAIPLTITKPVKLYLQSEAAQIVRPRVLDPDYQEYLPFNRSEVKFNTTFNSVNYDGHYSFAVSPENNTEPVAVEADVSVYPTAENQLPLWTVSHSALLFPRKRIYPQNPIIQNGAQLQFQCQASQPDFISKNERVATISSSGLLTARMEGKTVVQCRPDIETTVTVVKFESVSLRMIDPYLYKVERHFIPPNVENANLTFASDISYHCKWDATECGYAYDKIDEKDGQHYCQLTYHDRHLCPEHSKLKVVVDSPKTGINLVGETDVSLKNEYFLVTPILEVSIPKNKTSFKFDLKTVYQRNNNYTNNIICEHPPEVKVKFERNNSTVILQFLKGFKGGIVTFEHLDYPRERVKLNLTVTDDEFSSSKYFQHSPQQYDTYIYIASIILTLLMVVYVLYSLGEGELLPPFSPYQLPSKDRNKNSSSRNTSTRNSSSRSSSKNSSNSSSNRRKKE